MSKPVITISGHYKSLVLSHENLFTYTERRQLKLQLASCFKLQNLSSEQVRAFMQLKIAIVDALLNEVGLGKAAVISVLFQDFITQKYISVEELEKTFSTNISAITKGLIRVR
jgi:GTP pyrophosphokinase